MKLRFHPIAAPDMQILIYCSSTNSVLSIKIDMYPIRSEQELLTFSTQNSPGCKGKVELLNDFVKPSNQVKKLSIESLTNNVKF